MRLLVLSDLHHELWRDLAPEADLARSRPDLVILAGDIHLGAHAIPWAARAFAPLPVLYVAGNHEAYGSSLEQARQEIDAACARTTNVQQLHCRELQLGGVRFLGATLWTDFCLFGEPTQTQAMHAAQAVMNDYRKISRSGLSEQTLCPEDTARLHVKERDWLASRLAQPFAGKTVVITHMAPSMHSVSPRYADDPVSAGFASRLEHLVQQSDVWVHGHMHESFDYRIGKCRVVCNPCGYRSRNGMPENPQFDVNFVVDLAQL